MKRRIKFQFRYSATDTVMSAVRWKSLTAWFRRVGNNMLHPPIENQPDIHRRASERLLCTHHFTLGQARLFLTKRPFESQSRLSRPKRRPRLHPCGAGSSLPPEKRKSVFCTPDQEEDVARYHAQREAAAAAAAAPVAAGAANVTSDVAAGNATARRVTSLSPAAADGDGGNGSSNAPPRCLLWSDTVLSTEGHPFLASALANATAGAGDGAHGGARLQGSGDVCSSSSPSSTCRPPSPSATDPARLPTLKMEAPSSAFDGVKALIVKLERLRQESRQRSDP